MNYTKKGLVQMTKSSLLFLPEVNEKMSLLNAGYRPSAAEIRNPPFHDAPLSGKWKFFHRFSTGTELYFDPAAVKKHVANLTISIKQRLAPLDRRAFAMRFIRFPLVNVTEARFVLSVNCYQKVYTTNHIDFRDRAGNILGSIYPEKEEYVSNEYLFPGTSMRLLSDKICRERFR